jgi:hypothetical protein
VLHTPVLLADTVSAGSSADPLTGAFTLHAGAPWHAAALPLRRLLHSSTATSSSSSSSTTTTSGSSASTRFAAVDADLFGFAPFSEPLQMVRCLHCQTSVRPARFETHLLRCTHALRAEQAMAAHFSSSAASAPFGTAASASSSSVAVATSSAAAAAAAASIARQSSSKISPSKDELRPPLPPQGARQLLSSSAPEPLKGDAADPLALAAAAAAASMAVSSMRVSLSDVAESQRLKRKSAEPTAAPGDFLNGGRSSSTSALHRSRLPTDVFLTTVAELGHNRSNEHHNLGWLLSQVQMNEPQPAASYHYSRKRPLRSVLLNGLGEVQPAQQTPP